MSSKYSTRNAKNKNKFTIPAIPLLIILITDAKTGLGAYTWPGINVNTPIILLVRRYPSVALLRRQMPNPSKSVDLVSSALTYIWTNVNIVTTNQSRDNTHKNPAEMDLRAPLNPKIGVNTITSPNPDNEIYERLRYPNSIIEFKFLPD